MIAAILFLSPASKNLINKIDILHTHTHTHTHTYIYIYIYIYTRFVWISNHVSEPLPAPRPENKSASRIFEIVK
jgi:hypothetical protein